MSDTKRAAAFAALLKKAEGQPEAMLRLAALMREAGLDAEAQPVARRALALAPADPGIAVIGRAFLSARVSHWHFDLVRDEIRNAAYDAALRRAIRPGMRVLEIGTGTGLLAMMAARAGAQEVVTCEVNATIAETARRIIAQNGHADRVRVLTRHSDALDAAADLGGRMDLLVSEIISNSVLSEGVLPAHERAVRDLLKPGAPVIPARGKVRVALAEDTGPGPAPVTTVDGFDLSAMEEWRPASRLVRSRADRIVLRSAPADLFAFDFASASHAPGESRRVTVVASGGRADGIVQWIHLALDAATEYENAPGSPHRSNWALRFFPLAAPIETRPGEVHAIHGLHDRNQVQVWPGG
ncbi:MAG: class I SAM-dependent methyltransferase [Rhizomicrobium sp.]